MYQRRVIDELPSKSTRGVYCIGGARYCTYPSGIFTKESNEMSGWHLDEIDEQLLIELNNNARISLVSLGEKVHLSRNAVRQRIERMERDGIIAGYTVIRGKQAGVHSPLRAYFFVYRADRMKGGEVLLTISNIPEVVRCDILSGDFDVLVSIEAESADRVQAIWEQIAALPGVINTVTALSLSTPTNRSK